MYTQDDYKLDRLEIANSILTRLEMEYKYAVNKNVDKPEMVKFLADQLSRLSDKAVLSWNEALNVISDKGGQHPPSIPEIIEEMRKLEIAITPKPKLLNNEAPDYAGIWNAASDEERINFYKTYNKDSILPCTRWVIKQWREDNGF